MEMFKINNVNNYLKEEGKMPPVIYSTKQNIENYIKTWYCPTIDLKLDMNFDMLVEGDIFALRFSEMSLLNQIKKLLDIKMEDIQNVGDNEKKSYILGKAQARLSELRKVKQIAELVYQFPTLHSIFVAKEESIKISVALEQECRRILPLEDREHVKYKKFCKCGLTNEKHLKNLSEAPTFNLQTFVFLYAQELDNLISNLNQVLYAMSATVMNEKSLEALNKDKIMNDINQVRNSMENNELKK